MRIETIDVPGNLGARQLGPGFKWLRSFWLDFGTCRLRKVRLAHSLTWAVDGINLADRQRVAYCEQITPASKGLGWWEGIGDCWSLICSKWPFSSAVSRSIWIEQIVIKCKQAQARFVCKWSTHSFEGSVLHWCARQVERVLLFFWWCQNLPKGHYLASYN